jgi:hypothetical protein
LERNGLSGLLAVKLLKVVAAGFSFSLRKSFVRQSPSKPFDELNRFSWSTFGQKLRRGIGNFEQGIPNILLLL